MKLIKVRYGYEPGDVWPLWGFGDWHVGSANCDKKLLYKTRDRIIEDPRALWVHPGDAAECITVKDPRWASGGIDYEICPAGEADYVVDHQMHWIREFVEPILPKCLAWHEGNHEGKYSENTGHKLIVEDVLEPLGFKHLWAPAQQTTLMQFVDEHGKVCSVRLNSAHGKKTGQSVGAIINWAINRLRSYDDVDILMRGHHHHCFALKCANVSTGRSHSRLHDREGVIMGTGSAMKTMQEDAKSYAEDADFMPVVLGFPRVALRPDRETVRMEAIQ